MPQTSQLLCKVKAYDTNWSIRCAITMIKRSAPLEMQAANMQAEVERMESILEYAKLNWATKAFSLMDLDDIKVLVNETVLLSKFDPKKKHH